MSTTQADGDFRVPASGHDLDDRLTLLHRTFHERPWAWLRQVHGDVVVRSREPGDVAGSVADAVVTSSTDCPIAVTTADCAPVVLVATDGVAVIHAGWKGALVGVIEAAARELLTGGGAPVTSILGPCISASHYEFGTADLDTLAATYGASVRASTANRAPALDMAALIGVACLRAGWPEPSPAACTSDPGYFSHRTRTDTGRQTTAAWIVATDGAGQ